MDNASGADVFGYISEFIKSREAAGRPLSKSELQNLFNPNHFPELVSAKTKSAQTALNQLAYYYLSFESNDVGFQKIDVEHGLLDKLKETRKELYFEENPSNPVRNGLPAAAIKSVERISTVASGNSSVFKNFIAANPESVLAKRGIAPVRVAKSLMGGLVIVVVGDQAIQDIEDKNYGKAAWKLGQCSVILTTFTPQGTELMTTGFKKLAPELEKKIAEKGGALIVKSTGRAFGREVPLVGAGIEEVYCVVSFVKDGCIDHDWKKMEGNMLVCQAAAAGVLVGTVIPIPGLALVASEYTSQKTADWFNQGKEECHQVNGAASVTIWNKLKKMMEPATTEQEFQIFLQRQAEHRNPKDKNAAEFEQNVDKMLFFFRQDPFKPHQLPIPNQSTQITRH